MSFGHGKDTYFALDTTGGALTDISSVVRGVSGLPGTTERVDSTAMGDEGVQTEITGWKAGGPIKLDGLCKPSTAFVHGKDTRVLLSQYALSGYLRGTTVGRKMALEPSHTMGDGATGYVKSDIVGHHSGSVSLSGLFDDTPTTGLDTALRAALAAASSTVGALSVAPSGFALGAPVDMCNAKVSTYTVDTKHDGASTVAADCAVSGRVDFGVSLHDLTAETTTVNGTGVDESASSASGGVGHLHVTAFTGTSCVVKVQHSADDVTYADLITFSTVTGVTSERVIVTGTVNRYVRFAITSATITTVTLACAFARRGFTYGTAGTTRHLAGLIGVQSTAPTQTHSFAYGVRGSTGGYPKITGETRMSSLDFTYAHDAATTFSAELMVTGAITHTTF